MASAKAKIRHVFGDTFSCRAAPPDILVKLSASSLLVDAIRASNQHRLWRRVLISRHL